MELMSACNARPPTGHPWHGTLVACHLARGHRAKHSWEMRTPGPWAAHFMNGPVAEDDDVDRLFAVGPVWGEIRLARMPELHGWQIVGGSELDPPNPDDRVAWPGEVTYSLVEIIEGVHPTVPVDWVGFYRLTNPLTMSETTS